MSKYRIVEESDSFHIKEGVVTIATVNTQERAEDALEAFDRRDSVDLESAARAILLKAVVGERDEAVRSAAKLILYRAGIDVTF